jgi:crossover junction endodeoxyribonuclease RuvC
MIETQAGTDRLVLGVDPGYGRTGLGIVRETMPGRKLTLLFSECVETSQKEPQPERLWVIQERVREVLSRFGPVDEAAVEQLFFGASVTTAMRVAEARGVVLSELGRAHVPVFHYTPMQIKGLSGSGSASKRQVAFTVCHLLGVEKIPGPDDAADAVAAALWHLRGGQLARHAASKRAGGHERMTTPLRRAVQLAMEAGR